MKRPAYEPFDWTAFRRTFAFQPIPLWIASSLLLKPAAKATPALLRATCEGPLREGLASFALVVYALALPPAVAAAVYLLAGRRRMERQQRLMGDWGLALILLISAVNGFGLSRQASARWTTLGPGLKSLRAACWK